MKKYWSLLIISFILITGIKGQSLLQSGPMVGYSAMREVCLWVQTKAPAKVKFAYWDINDAGSKYYTKEYESREEEAFTCKLICDNVDEGKKYNYELYLNGKKVKLPYELKFQTQKLWQWRNDPPNFSFAAGSCAYINEEKYDRPGKPYGADYQIFKSIAEKKPDFMIWLGDNYYFREVDWDSWNGIIRRITHGRSIPELQPLLASAHHYAIWDDHDFGPNDSDRGFWNKDKTLKAFKLFWPNPAFGINGQPGVTTYFQWNDVDFFLLDDRFYKTPNDRLDEEKFILGEEQVKWLIDNLSSSIASFKIIAVGGQFLNDNKGSENFSRVPAEKKKILDAIEVNNIEGVIFLTGDVHRAEISRMDREGKYPIYDITTSPLTAGPSRDYPNSQRIPSTLYIGRNFAKFDITGTRKERVLKCTLYDSNGKEVWNYSITANELKNLKK